MRPIAGHDTVFVEEMTWMEVRDALRNKKTTVIVATGGVEENGPYVVTGKHNYILRATTDAIARALGNAFVAPIIAFVPEGRMEPPAGHMAFPGTISLTEDTFQRLLTDICSSFHGFRDIVLIGDSGGNQTGLKTVAANLTTKWTDGTTRVHFVPEYYDHEAVDEWLARQGIKEVDEGLHDGFAVSQTLAAIDPVLIRAKQRQAAKRLSINGIDLAPLGNTAEWGKKIIAYRAEAATKAIRRLCPNRVGESGIVPSPYGDLGDYSRIAGDDRREEPGVSRVSGDGPAPPSAGRVAFLAGGTSAGMRRSPSRTRDRRRLQSRCRSNPASASTGTIRGTKNSSDQAGLPKSGPVTVVVLSPARATTVVAALVMWMSSNEAVVRGGCEDPTGVAHPDRVTAAPVSGAKAPAGDHHTPPDWTPRPATLNPAPPAGPGRFRSASGPSPGGGGSAMPCGLVLNGFRAKVDAGRRAAGGGRAGGGVLGTPVGGVVHHPQVSGWPRSGRG